MNAMNLRAMDPNTILKIQTAAISTGLKFNYNQCESILPNGYVIRCKCCLRHNFHNKSNQ